MDQDLAKLQIISDILKEEPKASQRKLAEKAGMSVGLMNSILQRFVERGWIMLSNVNGRKLAYALTFEGMSELAERGKKFAARTFQIANDYNEALIEMIKKAKNEGKTKVILYGKSYIKFLIIYACKEVGMEFVERDVDAEVDENAFCVVGEMMDSVKQDSFKECGCQNLLDMMMES